MTTEKPKTDRPNVLVLDDEAIVRMSCVRILSADDYKVSLASSGAEALKLIETRRFDILLTDLRMPGMDGISVLSRVKEKWPETEIIIITGHGTVGSAVQAMKYGAFDFIEKPFTPKMLLDAVNNALEKKSLLCAGRSRRPEASGLYMAENIVGASGRMQQVLKAIATVAPTDNTVLITGESGTGKEVVAKAIHFNSMRKDKPFVTVDCGAIPEGLIESELFGHAKGAFTGASGSRKGLLLEADGGSIFFDEIGNLSLAMQAKLLRAIHEHEFRPVGAQRTVSADIRFIAATNSDLDAMVKEGAFREDLFYRLIVFPIKLPPLRDRKEDIPALCRHYMKDCERDIRVSPEAMRLLMSHDWPGNIRQLINALKRAALLCEGNTVKPAHLAFLSQVQSEDVPRTSGELKEMKKHLRLKSIEEVEKSFLLSALERNDWNITRAADDVVMQRTNFHALLKKYGITARDE